MWPQSDKGSIAKRSKCAEHSRVRAIHHLNKVTSQLEGRTFEAGILTRRRQEEESKINVDQVASIVKQDIAVVTIFDLQKEAYNGICCKTLTKVCLGVGQIIAFFKMRMEETFETREIGVVLFQRSDGYGIRDCFNDPSAFGNRQNLAWMEPRGHALSRAKISDTL